MEVAVDIDEILEVIKASGADLHENTLLGAGISGTLIAGNFRADVGVTVLVDTEFFTNDKTLNDSIGVIVTVDHGTTAAATGSMLSLTLNKEFSVVFNAEKVADLSGRTTRITVDGSGVTHAFSVSASYNKDDPRSNPVMIAFSFRKGVSEPNASISFQQSNTITELNPQLNGPYGDEHSS